MPRGNSFSRDDSGQQEQQDRSWDALHKGVMAAALAQGMDPDYAAAYLQRNQERILPRLMEEGEEETADPARAEARDAIRIARTGPNGWRMIYRGNVVLGRCQRVESATPGCSGTGGRDTYYYVESGCGPYTPRRENTTTLADVRALFETRQHKYKVTTHDGFSRTYSADDALEAKFKLGYFMQQRGMPNDVDRMTAVRLDAAQERR